MLYHYRGDPLQLLNIAVFTPEDWLRAATRSVIAVLTDITVGAYGHKFKRTFTVQSEAIVQSNVAGGYGLYISNARRTS